MRERKQKRFSLEIPIKIGSIDIVCFVNQFLFVTGANTVSVPHNHHDYELRYIANGSMAQLINDKEYIGGGGDILLVQPLEYHCRSRKSDAEKDSAQYNLRFTILEPKGQKGKRSYLSLKNALSGVRFVKDEGMKILAYLRVLQEELKEKNSGYIDSVRSLCTLILLNYLRLIQLDTDHVFPKQAVEYRGYGRSQIDEFFLEKYLTDVRIEDLADDMKISPRQLNRVMNKMFGMSFTEKLTEMRLKEAALRLSTSDVEVVKISALCGFKNYNNFYQCFKKFYCMSPLQYRNQKSAQNGTKK